jgi:hypothetical protein
MEAAHTFEISATFPALKSHNNPRTELTSTINHSENLNSIETYYSNTVTCLERGRNHSLRICTYPRPWKFNRKCHETYLCRLLDENKVCAINFSHNISKSESLGEEPLRWNYFLSFQITPVGSRLRWLHHVKSVKHWDLSFESRSGDRCLLSFSCDVPWLLLLFYVYDIWIRIY